MISFLVVILRIFFLACTKIIDGFTNLQFYLFAVSELLFRNDAVCTAADVIKIIVSVVDVDVCRVM